MNREVVLTPEGFDKLQTELEHLKHNRRREVAERLKQAIEFGDISENSEYEDAKREQGFVEGRIIEVNEMLSNYQLIEDCKITTDRVCVGCCVTIKDMETGEKEEYRLVGSVEADPVNHKISNESPVGQALLGQCPGQVVEVCAPIGTIKYQIVSISK